MYSEIFTGDIQDKRFFGIYRGIVVDTNDPKNLGRLKMQIPQILGTAVTNWSWPIIGGYTPQPGDGCWVMFEGGDPNFPLWLGAF
jgi:hypothetical protein